MTFCIKKPDTELHSHCGVIEFTADEGVVFMPKWMMENMKLQDGEMVNIENMSLLQGTYIKLQPHATKFIMLSNHKSLLEKAFKDFACLTPGDTIVINHEDEKYLIDIVETKPSSHAIALFDTDCEVDFATPLDYKEPEKKTMIFTRDGESVEEFMKNLGIKESNVANKQQTEFTPFMGQARRFNEQVVAAATKVKENDRSKVQLKKEQPEEFKAFTGKSFRLI
ncbi:ubiquitin fusion degradation protein 1 [Tanacetum coccineum]